MEWQLRVIARASLLGSPFREGKRSPLLLLRPHGFKLENNARGGKATLERII